MTSAAKDLKRALVVQQISAATEFTPQEVEGLMAPGHPMAVLFDLMYEQIEGLQETNLRLNDAVTKAQQKADLAAMKAQEYFVRLRDGKLLNQGETF
jgi:hypothetical protein